MGKVEEKDSEVNLEKKIDYPYSSTNYSSTGKFTCTDF